VLHNCITRGRAVGAQLIGIGNFGANPCFLSGRALRLSPAAIMLSMAASSNRNKNLAQNLDNLHDFSWGSESDREEFR
jgi:hypothetical protein